MPGCTAMVEAQPVYLGGPAQRAHLATPLPGHEQQPGAVTASTRPRLRATWSAAPTRPVAGGRGGLPHVVFSRIAQCRPEVEHAGGRVTGGESEPGDVPDAVELELM